MIKKLRVLDLTMHLSGPYCCWLLASAGAEVIKIERPDGGDPVRETGPFVHGESTYFGSVNRGKRGIVIDLKSTEGKQLFAELIKTADVLVENFRAGVLARLGFDEATLRDLNPSLIFASITGFGQDGPMAKRPAFDIVIQGMSGMMSITGSREGPPTAVGISVADITTGVFAALAITSALLERERTGMARRVEISMMHCQLALLENAAARYLNAGEVPNRNGSAHPKITPFQSYSTADGTVVIAADGEKNWKNMCAAFDMEPLTGDPRFLTNDARVEHSSDLEAILAPIFKDYTTVEIVEKLLEYDVPCGPVQTIPEVLGMDLIAQQNMIAQVTRGSGVDFQYVASPIAGPHKQQERPAPNLGEHTDEILQELQSNTDA